MAPLDSLLYAYARKRLLTFLQGVANPDPRPTDTPATRLNVFNSGVLIDLDTLKQKAAALALREITRKAPKTHNPRH